MNQHGRGHDIGLIVGRELRTRLRTKSLLISTGIMLALVLAGAILPGLTRDDGPTAYDVGLVGDEAQALAEPLGALDRADADVEVRISAVAGRERAGRLVDDGDLDAAVDGTTVLVEREVSPPLAALLAAAARSQRLAAAVEAGDIAPEAVDRLTDPQPLTAAPRRPSDAAAQRRSGLMRIGSFLLYGQILGYSMAVASGVVEEKSSRVVEVLLAKVRPADLLAGKVIGLGLLGLGQLALLVSVGLTAASLADTVDLPPGWPSAAAQIFGWFLLGYTFYSCAFAVGGALVSRQEELQNTSAPITFLLISSFVLATFAASDPDTTLATVGSMLPFSAPLVMPLRTAVGAAPVWQMVAAVALTAVSAVAMVAVAGRVYTGGALRFGGRVGLIDAWRGGRRATPAATVAGDSISRR